ncbi:MOSC domain-containing protein [Streptomyces sp. NPDC006645]|uniref:MOSC domain-containing protein n=1 Tax=unclassified Streptomyces TaxID=2593676 RepID=UPI0033BD7573
MRHGRIVSLHIAPAPGAPTRSLTQATAVTGRGLEGDRNYWPGQGPRPRTRGAGRASGVCDLTLIEYEALDALTRETGIELSPAESRRNVVCRGVRLNPLVGATFRVGDVVLLGLRLSEPCARLEQLTRPGLIRGLIHRGGLRAEILRGGPIRVGDAVHPAPTAPPLLSTERRSSR